jgi:acyl-coenzyme A synthetase/AMP-(fatty) acid ligase
MGRQWRWTGAVGEGRDWELKVIGKDGQLGRNLIDESDKLPWQKITDPFDLENSLVILIYSSGTTGLPKGKYTRLEMSQRPTLTTYRRQAISSQSCS